MIDKPWCVFGSGSRDLRREHYPLVETALKPYVGRSSVFIHGEGEGRNGSVGFDRLAEFAADKLGFRIYGFPADWDRLNKGAGPRRNQLCAELLFAFASLDYQLALVLFPTGGPGTSGTFKIVKKMSASRSFPVQIMEFPVLP